MKYNKDENAFSKLQKQITDDIVRRKIGTKEYHLVIHEGRQGKHIVGHNDFKQDKSYLAVSTVDEGMRLAQEIIEKYHGTGILTYNKDKTRIKERVKTDRLIGYIVEDNGDIIYLQRI